MIRLVRAAWTKFWVTRLVRELHTVTPLHFDDELGEW